MIPHLTTKLPLIFIGDTRGAIDSNVAGAGPQSLSESSIIFGLGAATASWKGALGWFEAGESLRYRGQSSGSMTPDYRGGISFSRGAGHRMGESSHGLFTETNEDGIYVSRFQHDLLLYAQSRGGYTFRQTERLGFQAQLFMNGNVTVDSKRQYWANYFESGPGIRFRFAGLPPSLQFTISALRGTYLVQEGNPHGPTFYDFRAGFWYAFTH